MALSILRIGYGEKSHCLYESGKEQVLMIGLEDEVTEWKHIIENYEQEQANKEYFDQLRAQRISLLVKAGNSPEQAETFLRAQMPYLFT